MNMKILLATSLYSTLTFVHSFTTSTVNNNVNNLSFISTNTQQQKQNYQLTLHSQTSSSSSDSNSNAPEIKVISQSDNDATANPPTTPINPDVELSHNEDRKQKPSWMVCINSVSPKSTALNEAVSKIADVSLETANELIDIGAVWAKMDVLSEEDILDQYNYDSSPSNAQLQYSDLATGWHSDRQERDGGGGGGGVDMNTEEQDIEDYIARMESRRYNRILSPTTIDQGTDLRVYPNPRRFNACDKFGEENRLLHQDTTFVIVDKPPLLPTQPDASNYMECCPGCVERYYGPFPPIGADTGEGVTLPRPLLCHRVDSVVGGCVVLSKDRNGQAVFSQLQRERKVKKVYLAVTTEPVPLGMHVHWIWKDMVRRGNSGGPPCMLVSHEVPLNRKKAKSWIRCILEVVKCEPINISKDNEYGYNPGSKQHYQTTIRLVTGRKHQVRAQLASLGAPIIRDTLYEPIGGMTLDMLNAGGKEAMMVDWAVDQCRVPTDPIGLQAHAILFGGVKAKAGTPWWGDGTALDSE